MSRKNQSPFEDLIEIASTLPWKVGLALAVISYFIFHYIAGIDVTPMKDIKDMGSFMWKQIPVSFSMFLQYIVPIAFIFGSIISAIKQSKRNRIYTKQTSINSIRNLSWQDFELLVSEAYRRKGYNVVETPSGSDGGVDIILNKGDRKTLVQCKHWKKNKVGVKEVRELNGIVSAKAYSGILVTSGVFTTGAIEFAENSFVELIDGKELIELVPDIDTKKNTQQQENPLCPKCGSEMVKRTARKGLNAGNHFWGCSTFPDCKGIVNI